MGKMPAGAKGIAPAASFLRISGTLGRCWALVAKALAPARGDLPSSIYSMIFADNASTSARDDAFIGHHFSIRRALHPGRRAIMAHGDQSILHWSRACNTFRWMQLASRQNSFGEPPADRGSCKEGELSL